METTQERVVTQAINETTEETPGIENDAVAMFNRAWEKTARIKTDMFPSFCREAYSLNWQAQKALEDYGNKGKYTDTYGWSKDGNFLAKYIVPNELKNYMRNMVYYDFWDDSNAKVRDSFMKQVCRGGTEQEYRDLLSKVVLYYGANSGKLINKEVSV